MPNANLKLPVAKLCLGLCAAAVILGCILSAAGAGEAVSQKSRTYELKVGEEVVVAGADFTMLLGGVPEDSRCPEGVDCIWAGSVGAELVFCGPKAERSGRLNTNGPPRVLKYRGRYFRILQVSPKRVQGREIKPSDYVLTVEVTRQAPAAQGEGDVVEIKDE